MQVFLNPYSTPSTLPARKDRSGWSLTGGSLGKISVIDNGRAWRLTSDPDCFSSHVTTKSREPAWAYSFPARSWSIKAVESNTNRNQPGAPALW